MSWCAFIVTGAISSKSLMKLHFSTSSYPSHFRETCRHTIMYNAFGRSKKHVHIFDLTRIQYVRASTTYCFSRFLVAPQPKKKALSSSVTADAVTCPGPRYKLYVVFTFCRGRFGGRYTVLRLAGGGRADICNGTRRTKKKLFDEHFTQI